MNFTMAKDGAESEADMASCPRLRQYVYIGY